MASQYELNAEIKPAMTKGENHRLRLGGKVPGVVYGAGKAPVTLQFDHNPLYRSLENESFYSHILALKTGAEMEAVVVREVQRHPYKKQLVHIDLLRIKGAEKLKMSIPIHVTGEAEAQAIRQGGVLVVHLREVEIECLPADLPEQILIDVSPLELNHTFYLSDLPLPAGVKLTCNIKDPSENLSVVSIRTVRERVEEVGLPIAPTREPETESEGKAGSKTGE